MAEQALPEQIANAVHAVRPIPSVAYARRLRELLGQLFGPDFDGVQLIGVLPVLGEPVIVTTLGLHFLHRGMFGQLKDIGSVAFTPTTRSTAKFQLLRGLVSCNIVLIHHATCDATHHCGCRFNLALGSFSALEIAQQRAHVLLAAINQALHLRNGAADAGSPPAPAAEEADVVWWQEAERCAERQRQQTNGEPESLAELAKEQYNHQGFGCAALLFGRAIDRLHTLYCIDNFQNRQPSPADAWMVDGYSSAIGASHALYPRAPIDGSVREATHRLRTIASACERVGASGQLYLDALASLGINAPDVKIDDILW